MPSPQLTNYLRSNRKRLALFQGEVAFLLGGQSGTKVSRYEQLAREPTLKTVLAYEVIFQKPARELFAGLYQEIEKEVTARAKTLSQEGTRQPNRRTAQKRQSLADIINRNNKSKTT